MMTDTTFHDLELETKPDLVESMKRVYAWYEGEILDRVPVRFAGHNEEFNVVEDASRWKTLEEKWFDTEYRVESFLEGVKRKSFLGETFPVFWPNLGPNVFAAILGHQLGAELVFGDVTSWCRPFVSQPEDLKHLGIDRDNVYYKKLIELTDYALERCGHQFMVGYTDMHPGLDCVDAMYGTTQLCLGVYDNPELLRQMVDAVYEPFILLMDEFHEKLHSAKQLSVSWLNVPSYERMHIPSCDLGTLISREAFDELELPSIKREIQHFTHNVFHVDGPGVARHIDSYLDLNGIQGFQWVQGVAEDRPIAKSLDLVRKIQEHDKGVIVDLQPDELEMFMREMSPKGIYLFVNEDDEETQREILRKLEKWR
jgi:hypothetical protein